MAAIDRYWAVEMAVEQLAPVSQPSPLAETALPPGPRMSGAVQTVRYTFDQPRFFAECRARFGRTWTVYLPGFPPAVVTSDRDAIRRLFTGDPLVRRHGNDLFKPVLGEGSLMLLANRPSISLAGALTCPHSMEPR